MSATDRAAPLGAGPSYTIDPAELAALWVRRRYRLTPWMAALIAAHAGLGGLGR